MESLKGGEERVYPDNRVDMFTDYETGKTRAAFTLDHLKAFEMEFGAAPTRYRSLSYLVSKGGMTQAPGVKRFLCLDAHDVPIAIWADTASELHVSLRDKVFKVTNVGEIPVQLLGFYCEVLEQESSVADNGDSNL